ncbi:hypothetical protein QYM36_006192 [Artemia franciscana]|uniref:Endonuclease/exonuclease/phosphatase domain-containing protein n=1 Tax=Artemia franciscana TaxID=6661 RepID=A0AA88HUG7_ARTSF|nr:hypothetical protein QYM36_006192 [Artemia franciscana]
MNSTWNLKASLSTIKQVLLNDLDFTYIDNSGVTSALDFFLHTKQTTLPLPSPYVNTTITISDHLPVSFSFDTTIKPSIGLSKVRKWRKKSDWKKINIDIYQCVCDEILGRIKVPYHLLQTNPSLETTKKHVDLNVYCMEIIHVVRVAEGAAVPQRRVCSGTKVPRWKENPLPAQLCHASKFWHKIWMDIRKPRLAAMNTVRIYLKIKFVKCLQKHNTTILDENSNTLKSDTNAMWNFLKRKKRRDWDDPNLWPTEDQWNSYYKVEFAAPDAQLVSKYEDNLDPLLSEASPSLWFMKHNTTILDENSNTLKSDTNAMWNFLKRKKRRDWDDPNLWPTEDQWNSYYKVEFAAPDAQLVSKYEDNLDPLLSEASPSLWFMEYLACTIIRLRDIEVKPGEAN